MLGYFFFSVAYLVVSSDSLARVSDYIPVATI